MYELVKITEKSYYIESPVKIGLIKLNDREVCLIDSGNDKDAGRRVKKILDSNGWTLKAIYNTHSHADHIGGNKYLQLHTGCDVYANDIECAFTKYPVLEPAFLFGAYPPKDLKHKFLCAEKSMAQNLTDDVLPDNLKMIDLSGHSFNMVGFRTDDGVVYLADCLSSKETINKYQISFIYDVAEYIKTLEIVKSMEAKRFVPAHAAAVGNIAPLAELNINKVYEIADKILRICTESVCFETILQRLFNEYSLKMSFEQYALVGSTVRSYIAWLKDMGKIIIDINDNMLWWKRA
jgi:glyoxylase-like metal-dependent hydrolase (beta-lactamase superfamily II)